MSVTKAQKSFLREHLNEYTSEHYRGVHEDGYRPRMMTDKGSKTWDFVARAEKAGLVEIVDLPDGESMGWPFRWEGTRLTAAGREAAR